MIIASIGYLFSLTKEFSIEINIITTISYLITMFSLYCLIKMINFLFDLNNKDLLIESESVKKTTSINSKNNDNESDSIRIKVKSTGEIKLIKRSEWKDIINNKEQNMYEVIYN